MVNIGRLSVGSIGFGQNFNWIWLVELLVSGILVLFFLFYFNRLFATLISYGLRAYTWHKFRVYIDIQAFQISFLGGRIFFKGIRYHGENETIFVQNGYITWTYWLQSARQVDLARYEDITSSNSKVSDVGNVSEGSSNSAEDKESGLIKKVDGAQSRIAISISGLEWFVYNRTPVYDSIIGGPQSTTPPGNFDRDGQEPAVAGKKHGTDQPEFGLRHRHNNGEKESNQSSSGEYSELAAADIEKDLHRSSPKPARDPLTRSETLSTLASNERETPASAEYSNSLILRFLPIYLECQKGAISLGNENTRAILVTTFEKAKGHIDAAGSGPLDFFRQLFEFDIEHPVVQMKPNPDFRQSQQTMAEKVLSSSKYVNEDRKWWSMNWHLDRRRRKIWHGLRNLVPRFRSSVESFHGSVNNEKRGYHEGDWQAMGLDGGEWLGLSRYLDDDERDDHEGWQHVDYARFSTVLDCPSIHMNFYWDVPGMVAAESLDPSSSATSEDINGAEPPAYGIDLAVRGGTINYGPWADRLRAELQTAFLPNGYRSAEPAQRLRLGASRQSTIMTIRVEVESEVTLRVPTKESSKDWQWKGRANALRRAANPKKLRTRRHFRFRRDNKTTLGPDVRPFGWLSFSVAADSTVRYEMDMVARQEGYRNRLELDLKGTKATSSVNHAPLWRCEAQRLSCDLSNPLIWNSLHTWSFDIYSQAMELFLLRDHMFLLIDLINDFTSGPKPEYMTFVPFYYHIGLVFADFKLYLNANDSNIIDNPCDLEDNAFLILGLKKLNGSVDIPIRHFAASQNSVLFSGDGRDVGMDFAMPLWNTFHTFASKSPVAILKDLSLNGSYNYCAAISSQLTDSLVLDINGTSPRVFLHGFLIRYFMNVKENYFGEDMHFKTLEEYQDTLAPADGLAIEPSHMPTKKENDMDVILTVRADHSCVLMPGNLYSRKSNVRFDIILVEADMRFTNYYMDLDVTSSPIEVSLESIASEDVGVSNAVSNCQLFIDGVTVYGHRLFGAPPMEPTYVCNWDFDVGKIVGECSSGFLQNLVFSIQSFAFGLDDEENAIPITHKDVIHDITLLRAHVDFVRLWLVTEDAALLLETDCIDVSLDDWAGLNFSKHIRANIPDVVLAAVDRKSASRHHDNQEQPVVTLAGFQTSIDVGMLDKKANFARERALQQHHVRYHDRKTHRADFFLHNPSLETSSMMQAEWADQPPAMPVPIMPRPEPEGGATGNYREGKTLRRPQRPLSHNRSFLSLSSSRSSRRERTPYPETRTFSSGYQIKPTPARHEDSHLRHARERPFQNGGTALNSTLTFSSPWTSPYFPLQNVRPDMGELPRVPPSQLKTTSSDAMQKPEEYTGLQSDSSSDAHTGILCTFKTGLSGFCTPEFFVAISVLLQDLKPKHPVDLLDSVQISTMSEIVEASNRDLEHGQLTDITMRIPFTHVRIISTTITSQNSDQRDQYDATMSQVHVTGRIRTMATDPGQSQQSNTGPAIHALAKEIAFTISEKSMDGSEDRASARGSISDLSFWLSSQKTTRANLQLRTIEVVSWGKRVEYLASLIARTEVMTEKIIRHFKDLSNRDMIQHLVYHLTLEDNKIADPIFLTRPSYVLRSAGDHLRLNDSWKIVSRLRHIYGSLPISRQNKIVKQSFDRDVEIPRYAEKHVRSSFEQWKNWDHDGVDSAPIMSRIFDTSALPTKDPNAVAAIEASVSIGSTTVVLDPGPRQSAFVLGDMDAAVSTIMTCPEIDYLNAEASPTVQKINVQSYISQIALNVDWELVELVGDTLEQFKLFDSQIDSSNPDQSGDPGGGSSSVAVSVVFGADNASMLVDSINLSLRLASEKPRCSLLHSKLLGDRQRSSIVLASTTASAKLKSKVKTLLGWRLFLPSVYASHVSDLSPKNTANDLRFVGTCHRLRFDIKEDILGILDVVHQVVGDEVVFVHSLMSRIEHVSQKNMKPKTRNVEKLIDVHIAMFLDDYKLKLALLPSFKYVIAGEVARTSVVPLKNGKIAVDFDLKHHGHSFQNENDSENRITPTLEMPPVNGRVLVLFEKDVTTVEVQTTVEQISFEAAAVRACIDALNRPDLARIVVETKESARRAQSKVNSIFSSAAPSIAAPETPQSVSVLKYTCHLSLAGLSVHCSAPSIKSKDYRAELDLMLGFMALSLQNRTENRAVVHQLPQIELNILQVALGVRRKSPREDTNFGRLGLSIRVKGVTEIDGNGHKVQVYRASSDGVNIDMYAETASLVVDVIAFLQDRLKSFTLNDEARIFRPLRRLTVAGLEEKPSFDNPKEGVDEDDISSSLFNSVYSLELSAIQARWMLYEKTAVSAGRELEDLVFSIQKVDLKTKREGSARLAITDLQLQMVPKSRDPIERSSNSALLPEVIFNAAHISTKQDRRFAFQVVGKALDLQLASDFIVPASVLQKSLGTASTELRAANAYWASRPAPIRKERTKLLGNKRLASLLVDADFAGAVVNIKARKEEPRSSVFGILKGEQRSRAGRYGQVVHGDSAREATLRAPGVALKVEYRDNGNDDPALSAELKVAASSNVLYPSVVPLLLEISSSVKEIIGDSEKSQETENTTAQRPGYLSDVTLNSGDPVAILGRCKLNAGLWIQRQEFSLSCQPIARVSATARFDDIFVTVNTVQTPDQDRFFALLTTFKNLQASVQHVYSRESTASFEVESITISMMNSKHISSKTGISAILNISPMKTDINAKQLQDFLLFREIWYPAELRQASATPTPTPTTTDAHVQRYQQVATGAFPWNAVVSIQELRIQLDLGQGLGKSVFKISKLWASSKKSSDLEQNLCIGFEKAGIDCTGRMSGFIELQDFHVRTAIRWPHGVENTKRAPLVQGSVGFAQLRIKAALDYQMFAVADISSFEFLMYNVRESEDIEQDRLVGILNGDKVQVFCTTATAGQGLALYQAFERLVQEKQEAYRSSLRELDRYLRRKSVFPSGSWGAVTTDNEEDIQESPKTPYSLHTDVVVTLREVNIGAFPTTFFDNQIFKVEATDAQARFAVAIRNEETQCGLGMTLGQLRVALATVNRPNTQALGEVSVSDIIQRATTSKGGIIMKVPKLIMSMQTFQEFESNVIRYTFKSIFEGKVDVGWNYSRISFIRGMWSAHTRALAQRLGKPLPQPALKITTEGLTDSPDKRQEKITAVVEMPQSKFDYIALEPPIIDTPQLRDLGEATPSLEWAGLHRDRLPNVTHQIIIVTLLEVAREVEDAYSRILGSV